MVENSQGEAKSQGANRTPFDNYKELMDDSLNKIIKSVSKSKNKELIELCQAALSKSNKHFWDLF